MSFRTLSGFGRSRNSRKPSKIFLFDSGIEPPYLCRKISEDKYRRGDEFAFKTKHFFCDDEGHRINYDAYRMYFERRMMSAVGRKLTPHALRHTHTAMLAEAGVPLETISRRLGHSDSEITRQVYMHVTNKMREKDREIVNRVKILT